MEPDTGACISRVILMHWRHDNSHDRSVEFFEGWRKTVSFFEENIVVFFLILLYSKETNISKFFVFCSSGLLSAHPVTLSIHAKTQPEQLRIEKYAFCVFAQSRSWWISCHQELQSYSFLSPWRSFLRIILLKILRRPTGFLKFPIGVCQIGAWRHK